MIKTYEEFKKINEKKDVIPTVFTRTYLTDFLKKYGFTLNIYRPIMSDMSININMVGDKYKYEKMLNRLISLNYKDIVNINTIKKGLEFKIFLKNN